MMLSILERMNPAVCLGARLSLIYDNPKNIENDDDDNDIRAATLDSNDFRQLLDHDDDDDGDANVTLEDPNSISNAIVLRKLRRTIPELLDCIAKALLSNSSAGALDNTVTTESVHEKENRGNSSGCCISSLQALHDLTTKEYERNRVPLVCNNEPWDVVHVLSAALLASTVNADMEEGEAAGTNNASRKIKSGKLTVDEHRRLILWTLNNLSIPYENKASMALGKNSSKLLQALTRIIELNLPESYLCCICLLNLTFSANVIPNVTLYVPPSPPPPQSRTQASKSKNMMRLARSQTVTCDSRKTKSPTDVNIAPVHARGRSLDMMRRPVGNGKDIFSFEVNSEGRGGRISNALGNSSSLIRVVEQMMLANTPFLLTSVRSVQGEAIRWSCGFIRNVTYVGSGFGRGESNNNGVVENGSPTTSRPEEGPSYSSNNNKNNEPTSEEICLLLSQTDIPRLMMQYVKDSPRPIIEWTKDSLEDMCLGAMCNMAQWQSTREALWRAGAFQSLKKLEEYPGIHGYRARAIRCSLSVLQSRFR